MRQLCFCPLFFHYFSLLPFSFRSSILSFSRFTVALALFLLDTRFVTSWNVDRAPMLNIYLQRNGHGRADARITDRQDAVLQGTQTFFTATATRTRNQRSGSNILERTGDAIFQLWSLTSASRFARATHTATADQQERDRAFAPRPAPRSFSDRINWYGSFLSWSPGFCPRCRYRCSPVIPVPCFLLSFLRCLLVSLPGVMDEIQRMLFAACLETFNFLLVVACNLLVVRGVGINFNGGKFSFFTIDTGKLQTYLVLKLSALHIFDQYSAKDTIRRIIHASLKKESMFEERVRNKPSSAASSNSIATSNTILLYFHHTLVASR